MLVKFYNVSKKQNSTLLPTSTPTEYECIIKDDCSILAPVIKLDIGVLTSPNNFNYAYIPDWNRYYFITNWTYATRLWVATLSVDVLATYKEAIGNYEGYVLRSASKFNGAIADTTYPQKVGLTGYSNKVTFSQRSSTTVTYHIWYLGDEDKYIGHAQSWEDFTIKDGYFYVTMLGTTNGSTNKYNIYTMDYTEYSKFISALFNTDYSGYSKGTITNDVYKYLADPLQWIVSVKWCPFYVPGATFEYKVITFGGLTSNTYTVKCADVTEALGMRIEYVIDKIPSHPDFASRGKWVNNEPYIYIDLDFQPFGNIKLDRSKIPTNNDDYSGGICIMWDVDIHTGDAIARIYGYGGSEYNIEQHGPLLGTLTGSYMVDMPIAQTRTNTMGFIGLGLNALGDYISSNATQPTTLANSGGSTNLMGVTVPTSFYNDLNTQLSGSQATNPYSGAVGQTLSNIGNVLTGANLSVSSRGAQGSFIGVRDPFCDCWWTSMVEEDSEHSGRPLCETVKLNSLSGYILCRDGDIALNATQAEKSAVSSYLTTGFFYE